MSSHFCRLPVRHQSGEVVTTELPAETLVLPCLLHCCPSGLGFMHLQQVSHVDRKCHFETLLCNVTEETAVCRTDITVLYLTDKQEQQWSKNMSVRFISALVSKASPLLY